MSHFKLTEETRKIGDLVTLYRIEALVDLPRRNIKKGDKGGWVEKLENLADEAWVYDNARVFGDARVFGNACLYGDAQVYGNARVFGNAWLYGDARVFGNAWLYGDARVMLTTQILTISLGCWHTATITPKHVSVGCTQFTREGIKKLTRKQALKLGLPAEFADEYRRTVLAAMRLIKE